VNLKGSKDGEKSQGPFAGESQVKSALSGTSRPRRTSKVYNDVSRCSVPLPRVRRPRPTDIWNTGGGGRSGDRMPSVRPAESQCRHRRRNHEYTDMYPGMAKSARDEGFGEIADWFETLAKAERSHANRFQKALDNL